jgi:hypothetical protein
LTVFGVRRLVESGSGCLLVTFRFAANGYGPKDDLYSGALRIGIHAQAFADGGSASFVTYAAPVPEPETYAMVLLGLGVVGFVARRRKGAKT